MTDQVNETEEVVETEVAEVVEETTDVVEEAPEAEDGEITAEDALAILSDDEDSDEEEQEQKSDDEIAPVENKSEDDKDEESNKVEDEDSDEAFMETIKNDRTRERFQTLSHKNKELTDVVNNFQQQVASTGLSAQDFTQVVDLMGKANSDNPENIKEARAFIRDLDKTLSERIGDVPDAYERFDDLKQDYEDGELSEEYANKMAQQRMQEQVAKQRQEQAEQQQQMQDKAVMEQANAIESMVQQFKANDPDFALKEAQLEKMTAKIVADGVPMANWATEFVNRYHRLDVSQRKVAPEPMSVGRQGKNINNYASADMTDDQANIEFAMNEIFGR